MRHLWDISKAPHIPHGSAQNHLHRNLVPFQSPFLSDRHCCPANWANQEQKSHFLKSSLTRHSLSSSILFLLPWHNSFTFFSPSSFILSFPLWVHFYFLKLHLPFLSRSQYFTLRIRLILFQHSLSCWWCYMYMIIWWIMSVSLTRVVFMRAGPMSSIVLAHSNHTIHVCWMENK